MRIIVLGAGHVGRAIVGALYEEHEVTVIDTDADRLQALADRYDVRTVEGNGTTKRVVAEAGIQDCSLFIASTSREEANLVSAMLVKKLSRAMVVVRTTSVEYLDAWREREIDVDFMVSSELETANAISGLIGIPAARQTDVFADGQVQIVEFDVPANASVVGKPLRTAPIPKDSKVVSIIRGDAMRHPSGAETIEAGDRIVVIASPASARQWSRVMSDEQERVDDIVIFGAGQMGTTIARVLLDRDIRVRFVEGRAERAREVAEELPDARVFHASAFDGEFFARERIGSATAAVFALNDDPGNLFSAVLAKAHGVKLTIALAHDQSSIQVYENGGVDVAINPRQVVAEELVRFGHDPRIRQIAMLDDDRFEILDLTVRGDSELADTRFDELPQTGSVIGAIIRDGTPIFPHGDDVLKAGDRVIVFVESRRASLVERVLMRTGIDVGSALDLVGGVLKWLAPAFLAPTAVAIGYGEPFWSFLVAGAITGAAGLALDQITGEKQGAAITPRESFLVVALIWLLVPIFGALPFILDGGPQLSRPVDAYFEAVSGFTATGATLVAEDRTAGALDALLAPAQPLARRHGHHRARRRDPAAAADRRAPAAAVRARRPDRDRAARRHDPPDRAKALAPLRRPHADRDRRARCS